VRQLFFYLQKFFALLFVLSLLLAAELVWHFDPTFAWAKALWIILLLVSFISFYSFFREIRSLEHWKSPVFLLIFLMLLGGLILLKQRWESQTGLQRYFATFGNCRSFSARVLSPYYLEQAYLRKWPVLSQYVGEFEELCRGNTLLKEYTQPWPVCARYPNPKMTSVCYTYFVRDLGERAPRRSFSRLWSMARLWRRMNGITTVHEAAATPESKSFSDRIKELSGIPAASKVIEQRLQAVTSGKDPSTITYDYKRDVWDVMVAETTQGVTSQPSFRWLMDRWSQFRDAQTK
jgi:hypothetical protein